MAKIFNANTGLLLVIIMLIIGLGALFLTGILSFTPLGCKFDGICTQEIIDECCHDGPTAPVPTAPSCPTLDPTGIPYEEFPYEQLEALGYDLVAACAAGTCTSGVCKPLIEWNAVKGDWYFRECKCFVSSDLGCKDMVTEGTCEEQFCVGVSGWQDGYVKRCDWIESNLLAEPLQRCWCPYDMPN